MVLKNEGYRHFLPKIGTTCSFRTIEFDKLLFIRRLIVGEPEEYKEHQLLRLFIIWANLAG